MLKIGLVGVGFMGRTHAECYKTLEPSGVKITAVSDLIPGNAEKLSEDTGAEIYQDGMALIENGC